jgi:thymidylate kinase
VVEGNQGTGKSAAAVHLSGRLGAARFHFPPGFEALRERLALDTGMPARPRLALYMAATVRLSALVAAELDAGRAVVCDRYLAAPVSLLLAEGAVTDADAEPFVRLVLARIVRPDLTILMAADHGVAAERVRRRAQALGRSLGAVERLTVERPAFFARRAVALRTYSDALGPVVPIDSTALSPHDALAAVDRAVGLDPARPAR